MCLHFLCFHPEYVFKIIHFIYCILVQFRLSFWKIIKLVCRESQISYFYLQFMHIDIPSTMPPCKWVLCIWWEASVTSLVCGVHSSFSVVFILCGIWEETATKLEIQFYFPWVLRIAQRFTKSQGQFKIKFVHALACNMAK